MFFFSKFLVKDINAYIKKGEFSDKLKKAKMKSVTNMTNQASDPYLYFQYCPKFMENVLINK